MNQLHTRALALLALALLGLCGCGSAAKSSSRASTPTVSTPTLTPAVAELPAAEHPSPAQFPPARGRTLQQLAATVSSSAQLGPATGVFTPGRKRFAFALNTSSGAFVYAPTAIYIARTPNTRARGPFLAPADPLSVAPEFRSRQNSGPGAIAAIYAAEVPLPHKGTFTVLALTRTRRGMIGAPGEIAVGASAIPDVGERPPAIATDTPASVAGSIGLLSTRVPPDDMHSVSFKKVLGKRPIALLFSTPQLCTSRVCGPVTDIVVSLERQFAGRISFIHQEVYVDNQPQRGYRPPLTAFHLRTEPWLFTVNRHGVIVARLEGSFGVNEVTNALEAALK